MFLQFENNQDALRACDILDNKRKSLKWNIRLAEDRKEESRKWSCCTNISKIHKKIMYNT